MASRRIEGKVTPEVLQSVLLDEVAARLEDLTQLIASTIPQGNYEPLDITVTSVMIDALLGRTPPIHSFTITNDGPDTMTMYINQKKKGVAIRIRETRTINMNSPKIRNIFLQCAAGETAAIRISALW